MKKNVTQADANSIQNKVHDFLNNTSTEPGEEGASLQAAKDKLDAELDQIINKPEDEKISLGKCTLCPKDAVVVTKGGHPLCARCNDPITLPRRVAKEPGRNDPCVCGSGKKYKKCCL